MRIVLCGSREFGRLVLDGLLADGVDVALAVSPPWSGRSTAASPRRDSLRAAAERLGVPWLDSLAGRMPAGIDLIVAAHSHAFVSGASLRAAKLGGIGYHPSLLPRHRGRDAVRWTVAMGDLIAGGSVYWLTDQVDAGPLAAQEWCWVRPGDDAPTLWRRDLAPMGVRLLRRVVADLSAGTIVAIPQDHEMATWEPSWERPPLYRPDLLMIGPPPTGYVVQARRVV